VQSASRSEAGKTCPEGRIGMIVRFYQAPHEFRAAAIR
jgi:hypothetical protein